MKVLGIALFMAGAAVCSALSSYAPVHAPLVQPVSSLGRSHGASPLTKYVPLPVAHVPVAHSSSLHGQSHGAHGSHAAGYAAHGNTAHGELGIQSHKAHSSHGSHNLGGYAAHDAESAHTGHYDKYRNTGAFVHDKGAGLERIYSYDKKAGHHSITSDKGAHASVHGVSDQYGHHDVGAQAQSGHDAYGSHDKHGAHAHAVGAHDSAAHGSHGSGHHQTYFQGPGYKYKY